MAAKARFSHLFPNIFAVWDSPTFVTASSSSAAGLSVLFAVGWLDRFAAILLWYVWACLHGRMPLIANPGMPYIGWLLLAHACLPPAAVRLARRAAASIPAGGWRMPPSIFLIAWILLALGYLYSGLTKLASPSWLDGTAMEGVLQNPLARPGGSADFLLTLPPSILRVMTWGALAAEIAFAPSRAFRSTGRGFGSCCCSCTSD